MGIGVGVGQTCNRKYGNCGLLSPGWGTSQPGNLADCLRRIDAPLLMCRDAVLHEKHSFSAFAAFFVFFDHRKVKLLLHPGSYKDQNGYRGVRKDQPDAKA